MKKTVLRMMAAILTCGLATSVIASCGSDDDSITPSAQFNKIVVECSAEATQSTIDVFNVKPYYPDNSGNTTIETMTGTTWTKTIEIPASKTPCSLEYYILVIPKDPNGETSDLTFGKGSKIVVTTFDSRGHIISTKERARSMITEEVQDGINLKTFAKEQNNNEEKITFNIDKSGKVS
ncbi:MAG: hypothetical protein II752_08565 [Muribaculaceae bacterium]|nr:hypothetical protein [Muribaculaceae bacterium]